MKTEYCWMEFLAWCRENGIGLERQEDWEAWWDKDRILRYTKRHVVFTNENIRVHS